MYFKKDITQDLDLSVRANAYSLAATVEILATKTGKVAPSQLHLGWMSCVESFCIYF